MRFGILDFAAGAAIAFSVLSRAARLFVATLIDFDDLDPLAVSPKRGTLGRRLSQFGFFGTRAQSASSSGTLWLMRPAEALKASSHHR